MDKGTVNSPLSLTTTALSTKQLDAVYDSVHQIVQHLDAATIDQLTKQGQLSIDQVIDILIDESTEVISSKTSTSTLAFNYYDKLIEEVEETLRCKSLNYFILTVLPDFILGWHNIEWSNLIQINRLLCILAARDHGKSFHFSFAYPLWQMYRYQKQYTPQSPVPKELQMAREGLIITNEFGLARHFLSLIKEEIEGNPILSKRLLPDSKKEGWGAEKILCKNGASLAIKSAGSKIRGYHPTYIVMDDFLNESSLYSQDQRDKYWNIFSAVIYPALSPGGQLLIVGTPFFEKDLYATLKDKKEELSVTEPFPIFEYPAIFPNGVLLFPQRHTFSSLMQKKGLLGGLIFSREILVKPISDAASIFTYDSLRNAIRGQGEVDIVSNIDSSQRKYVKVVVGCDFAISSSVGADYSVFTIIGVDELGLYHILNCWRKSGANYAQQIAALKKINADFRPDIIYAEDNGMQQIFIQMMEDANLPVVGKTTNATNKKSLYKGIPSLAVLFETGRIKFPYGSQKAKDLTDLYFAELNSITYIQDSGKLESVSQHDDCGMSLWNAVNAAKGNLQDFDFSFI